MQATRQSFFICLFANGLLAFFIGQVNHALTVVSVYLYLSGLFLVFPAITLSFSSGLLCVFITGFLLDASLLLPFGLSSTFLALGFTISFFLRISLRRQHKFSLLLVALGLNSLLYLCFFLYCGGTSLTMGTYWIRGIMDFLFSSLVLVLIGGWFYDLQRAIFSACGLSLRYTPEIPKS